MREIFSNPEFQLMLNSSLRTYLLNLPGQWAGLVFACGMLERKRKLTLLIWYLAIKTLFFILFDNCMNFFFGEEVWVQYPMTIGTFWGALLTCLMFQWTFQGDFIKVITGMNIAEILTTLLLIPAIMIVNILQGRPVITDMMGVFHPLDLLAGILLFGILLAMYPLISSFLKKYRNYKFKHKKLLWVLFGGYFFITQTLPFFGLKDEKMTVLTMYLLHLLSAVVVIVGIFLVYRINQRTVQRENEFLRMQMHLMESHYRATQQQIRRMESGRKLVEQQMEELSGMVGDMTERITSYLQELRQEYDQLQAGMYCNDWMVDAVLYCQIETAKRQGISVDCSLQGYDRGMITEEDLVQLFLELLEFGIWENQKVLEKSQNRTQISLRAATVKNQLVIQFFTGARKKQKYKGTAVKKCVEKYGGTWTQQSMEQGWQLVISMDCQGNVHPHKDLQAQERRKGEKR